jgi:hypothetical protein
MRIYFAGSPEIPFNKPKEEAEAMIAAGLAFKYVEPQPAHKPDAQFGVQIWAFDKQPYIAASCNGCGNKAQFSGPTAHKTSVFRHCGVADKIPEHIAEHYAELRAKWRRSPARTEPQAEKLPAFELAHF